MSSTDPHELFKRIEQELEPRLAAKGYVKTKHDHHPSAFGSMFTVFSSPAGHVRFTWDGKDGWLILRVYRKRSRVMNTILMSFLGKYDLDRLMQEIIVKNGEIRTLEDEELVRKFAENVSV